MSGSEAPHPLLAPSTDASPTEHAPGTTATSVSPDPQPHDDPLHWSGAHAPADVLHWVPTGIMPQPASADAEQAPGTTATSLSPDAHCHEEPTHWSGAQAPDDVLHWLPTGMVPQPASTAASLTEHAPGTTATSFSPDAQPHEEPRHSSALHVPDDVLHWLPIGFLPQPASVAASPTEQAPGTTPTFVWPDAQVHAEPMHSSGAHAPDDVLHWPPMGFVPQLEASEELGVLDEEQAAATIRTAEANRIDFTERAPFTRVERRAQDHTQR